VKRAVRAILRQESGGPSKHENRYWGKIGCSEQNSNGFQWEQRVFSNPQSCDEVSYLSGGRGSFEAGAPVSRGALCMVGPLEKQGEKPARGEEVPFPVYLGKKQTVSVLISTKRKFPEKGLNS